MRNGLRRYLCLLPQQIARPRYFKTNRCQINPLSFAEQRGREQRWASPDLVDLRARRLRYDHWSGAAQDCRGARFARHFLGLQHKRLAAARDNELGEFIEDIGAPALHILVILTVLAADADGAIVTIEAAPDAPAALDKKIAYLAHKGSCRDLLQVDFALTSAIFALP